MLRSLVGSEMCIRDSGGMSESTPHHHWALVMRTDRVYHGGWTSLVYPVMGFAPAPSPEETLCACKQLYRNLAIYFSTFLQGASPFICGESPGPADFAMAPLVFALQHGSVRAATGFVLAANWCRWLEAFCAQVPSSRLLTAADGKSMGELLTTKMPARAVAEVSPEQFVPVPHQPGSERARARLLGVPQSVNAMSVALFGMHLLEDKFEFQPCNVLEGQHQTAEMLALNPFGQVPILEDCDGTCMGETTAILMFLAAKYSVQPNTVELWALSMRTDKVYNGGWATVALPLLEPNTPTLTDSETLARACQDLRTNLEVYANTFLGPTRKFVSGENPGVADFALAPLIFVLRQEAVKLATGFELPERWCHWLLHFEAKVPSSEKLAAWDGESIGEALAIKSEEIKAEEVLHQMEEQEEPVSYTHLTLPTKRIV
eukprot:TRINITY_DN8928_c0_g1_i4.p1 TRINITY_DN8928_c0_g1~~TRINITY_DN8928_c0_g1_i4.p1  ORF type:complete len:432 (-),score=115.31 TRINITY_DN8928_c0_g1_i4:131-1426(-)